MAPYAAAWIIDGLAAYYAAGRRIRLRGAVKDETSDYFADNDPIGQVIERFTVPEPGARIRTKALYDLALENGVISDRMKMRGFNQRLVVHPEWGASAERSADRLLWVAGRRLKSHSEPVDNQPDGFVLPDEPPL